MGPESGVNESPISFFILHSLELDLICMVFLVEGKQWLAMLHNSSWKVSAVFLEVRNQYARNTLSLHKTVTFCRLPYHVCSIGTEGNMKSGFYSIDMVECHKL